MKQFSDVLLDFLLIKEEYLNDLNHDINQSWLFHNQIGAVLPHLTTVVKLSIILNILLTFKLNDTVVFEAICEYARNKSAFLKNTNTLK